MLTSKPLTAPDAVSINYCDIGNEGLGAELEWRRLNLTELAHPYPNSELASRYGCSHIPTNIPPNGFTIMNNALYSLPLGLTSLNPFWESCTVMVVAQDPPRSLSRVSALVDPTTTAAALPSAAKPGASVDPQLTPTPSPRAAATASIKPTASGLDAMDLLGQAPSRQDSGHAGQQLDSRIPGPKLNNQPTSHKPTTGLGSQDPIQLNFDPKSTAHPSPDSNQDSTTQPQNRNINPLSTAAVVIGGQTFSSGSIPVTVARTTHSIAAPSGNIVVDSKTISQFPHSAPPHVLSVGSQTISYSINPASEIVVNSQTLHAGSAVVVASHTIALDTSADHSGILINGQPTLLPSAEDSSHKDQHSPDLQPVTVGGQTMTTNNAGSYMFGSQTLKNGGPAITVSGTPVSLAPVSEITIGASTIPLSPPRVTAAPQLTVGGNPFSTDSAGEYVVGSSTLRPGSAAITISNTPIRIDSSSSHLIVGLSIIQLPPQSTPNAALHVGDTALPYSINSASNLIIAGSQTLTPGGPAITISNTPISLGPSATQLVVGSSTGTLPRNAPSQALLSLGSTTLPYSINSASNLLVIGSQTLTPGGPAMTISNTSISIGQSATQLVVGSSTLSLSPVAPSEAPLSIGSTKLPDSIATASNLVIIGSQTLTPGGAAITVTRGNVVSAINGSSGPEVVVGGGAGRGSKTTERLGSVSMSGFGEPTGSAGLGNGIGSGSVSPTGFNGDGTRMRRGWGAWLACIGFWVLYVGLCI